MRISVLGRLRDLQDAVIYETLCILINLDPSPDPKTTKFTKFISIHLLNFKKKINIFKSAPRT